MGRYDEERKKLGISVSDNTTVSKPKSRYADERANLYKTANVVEKVDYAKKNKAMADALSFKDKAIPKNYLSTKATPQNNADFLPTAMKQKQDLINMTTKPVVKSAPITEANTNLPYVNTFKEVPKNILEGNIWGGIGNSLKGTGQMILEGFQGPQKIILNTSKAILDATKGKKPSFDTSITTDSYLKDTGNADTDKFWKSTGGQVTSSVLGVTSDPLTWMGGGLVSDAAKAAEAGTKGVINAAKIGQKASSKVAPYIDDIGNQVENVTQEVKQLPGVERLALAEKNTSKIELLPPKPQSGKTLEEGAKEFYDNAVKKYDDAIETVKNKFGTNELRQSEVDSIKPVLGIDLDELINNVSKAEKFIENPSEFAKYEKSRLAAGVISPTESKYMDDLVNYKTAENNLKDSSVSVKPTMYDRAVGAKEYPLTAMPNEVTPKGTQTARLVSENGIAPINSKTDTLNSIVQNTPVANQFDNGIRNTITRVDTGARETIGKIAAESKAANIAREGSNSYKSPIKNDSLINKNIETFSKEQLPPSTVQAKQYVFPSSVEGLQSLVTTMEKQQAKGIKINLQLFAQAKSKLEQMIKDYGMIKPGENPTREVRFPKQTSDTERVSQFARTAAESGNLTDEMASGIAKEVEKGNFSYEPITDAKAVEHAKATIGQEGLSKSEAKWKSVSNGKNVATKNDIALGEQLLTEYAKEGNTKKVIEMVSEIAIEGTRAGQVVQAMRLLKKMTPEGKLYYFEKYVDKLNSDLIDKLGAKAKKVEIDDALKESLLRSKSKQEIENVELEVIKRIAAQVPPTWSDKWNAWRYLSMLGNPKTHIKNIIGNAIFYPVRQFKNAMGAAMEKAIPVNERTKAMLTKNDFNLKDFAIKDFDEVKSTLVSGGKMDTSDLIMQNRKIFDNKALEWARNFNSKALDAEDSWFMKSAYVNSMAQFMKSRRLTTEFLESGTKQANAMFEQARKYASNEALRATFREANSAAQFLNRAKNVKVLGTVVEGLFPFKKTPLNIAKRGLEYSPIGLGKGVVDLLQGVKSGRKTTAEAIDQLAQGMTGTMIMGLGAYLSSLGIVNGAIETTKEGNFGKATGGQSYSLNIGGKSYTIDWMAPSVLPLMVGVELYNQTKDDGKSDSASKLNRLLNGLTSIEDPMFNLTMLQGLNSLFGNGTLSNKLASIPLGYAGQAVPTVAGQVARTIDTTRRSTYSSADSAKVLEQFARKNVAKIPGASSTLEPYIDQWGREQHKNPAQNTIENFASPGYMQTKSDDPIDNEIDRLYQETSNEDILPRSANSSVSYQKKTYNFTSKEYTQYQKTKGQTARELIEGVMSNNIYKSVSDDVKVKYLKRAYDMATDTATQQFLVSRGLK